MERKTTFRLTTTRKQKQFVRWSDCARRRFTHIFENEVDVFVVISSMDVQQTDNVGVIAKVLQEHDFTESPLGVRLIPECV